MPDYLRIIGVEIGHPAGERFSVIVMTALRPVVYFLEGDLRTALSVSGMSETMINTKIDSARRLLKSQRRDDDRT